MSRSPPMYGGGGGGYLASRVDFQDGRQQRKKIFHRPLVLKNNKNRLDLIMKIK